MAIEVIEFSQQIRPYRLAEQIAANALSISSNIAEGASYKSEKDFSRFLGYALGSASELSSQLYILSHIYTKESRINAWRKKLIQIRKMLYNFRMRVDQSILKD